MQRTKSWLGRSQVRFIIKVLCFFVTLILLLTILNKLFINKTQPYRLTVNSDVTKLPYLAEKWDGFYEKDKNSIDMLFLGTSEVHVGVDVNYLYNEYGFTSYDLSADQMPGLNMYYILKEAVKYQSPKVVFLDSRTLAGNITTPEAVHYSFDFMRQGRNRVDAVNEGKEYNSLSCDGGFFPFIEYHNRWEELNKTDFNYLFMDKLNMLNGHCIHMLSNPSDVPASHEKTEYRLSELGYVDTEKNIDRILNFCKKKGIECVLFQTPHMFSEEQAQYYDAIEKYANENNIKFWNFNNYFNEIGIDFSSDYVDGFHMNYMGSRKFTAFLGKMISEQFEYPDHRGTDGYEEWDMAYEYENYLIHAYQIRHYQTVQEYMNNNDYISDDLVYVYTYKDVSDLQNIIGVPNEVSAFQDANETEGSKILIMEKGKVVDQIMLSQGKTWTSHDLINRVDTYIESFSGGGTKIWFNGSAIKTEESAGMVDLVIYDKKLETILDHVLININAEYYLTHLLDDIEYMY